MKHTFVHLSDLHFRADWPEQIGLVYSSFIEDLKTQLVGRTNPYLVFSGDLVNAAAEPGIYDKFLDQIAAPLDQIGIPKEQRIVVPGNHDVSRDALKGRIKTTRGALEALDNEESFLAELGTLTQDVFNTKFASYKAAERQFASITCCAEKVGGAGWDLQNNLGIYCLNSALCSFAGVDDPKTGVKINDKELLSIDTRLLYQWEQASQSDVRVLVMHHPIEWLSDWARDELSRIIHQKFDLVLFGHHHVGVSSLITQGKQGCVFSMSPALFTRKSETLGYSIITIDTVLNTTEVAYRQWSNSHNFVTGSFIAGEDSGKRTFQRKGATPSTSDSSLATETRPNGTHAILELEFLEASTCFSSKRQVWVGRDLSKHPETAKSRDENDFLSCNELVKNPRSCVIRAPKGFGLSCLGAYVALEYFKKSGMQKALLLCKAADIEAHPQGVKKYIAARCGDLEINHAFLAGIILDGWENNPKSEKILRIIKELHPSIPILVFQGLDDFNDIQNASVLTNADGFEMLFLMSLDRSRVRQLVKSYLDESKCTADPDIVASKLIEDIDALNMHRTPLNCLLLLKLLERAFDDSPVNRTQMIGNVLFSLFHDFDKIPTYSIRPDLKDCERALGFLCEWLITTGHRSFTKGDFTTRVSGFCTQQLIDIDLEVLFNFLVTENILIRRGINFTFRHAYWLFYFAAQRMLHSNDFAKFILADFRYTAFPEVIEFYTGLDRAREDAVITVTKDLSTLDIEFLKRTQIDSAFDPFAHARWNPSDEAIERMHQEVTESIQESALPPEVKDAVADGTYDRSKPYHQEIAQFISQSSLTQMVQATKSAARALRNSDYVDPALRLELLAAVLTSWRRMCQILALLSPVLALSRRAQFDGMGFILDKGFEDTKEPLEVWKLVMTSIVENVISWYQGDLFSKKLAPLFKAHISKNHGQMTEALLLMMLSQQRPSGWDQSIEGFIIRSNKNSFYLQKVYAFLRYEFRFGFATEHSRQQIRRLASMAVAKHQTGVKHPNQSLIAKAVKIFDSLIDDEKADELQGDTHSTEEETAPPKD